MRTAAGLLTVLALAAGLAVLPANTPADAQSAAAPVFDEVAPVLCQPSTPTIILDPPPLGTDPIATPSPSPSPPTVPGDGVGGTEECDEGDTIGAAVAWSRATFVDGDDIDERARAKGAIIARHDLFPDSLSSGSLQSGRPLLLVEGDEVVDYRVNQELGRLSRGQDDFDIMILGDSEAVGNAVFAQMVAFGNVTRIGGGSRTDTAVAAAEHVYGDDPERIVLAKAWNGDSGDDDNAFADALAAGPYAAAHNIPVLLTNTETLPSVVEEYILEHGVDEVLVVGGSLAVSDDVLDRIREIGGPDGSVYRNPAIKVSRYFGTDRFGTATQIASVLWGYPSAAASDKVVLVNAIGDDAWAAGFAAASYSEKWGAPIILSLGSQGDLSAETSNGWMDGGNPSGMLVCAPFLDTDSPTCSPHGPGGPSDPTPATSFTRLSPGPCPVVPPFPPMPDWNVSPIYGATNGGDPWFSTDYDNATGPMNPGLSGASMTATWSPTMTVRWTQTGTPGQSASCGPVAPVTQEFRACPVGWYSPSDAGPCRGGGGGGRGAWSWDWSGESRNGETAYDRSFDIHKWRRAGDRRIDVTVQWEGDPGDAQHTYGRGIPVREVRSVPRP